MRLGSWVLDSVLFVFFLLMLREGRLVLGRERTGIFLWGSLLWTGIIENAMVMLGGYDYFAYANQVRLGGRIIQGYGGWVSWVLFVPLVICLGWFLLSLPALLISRRILGGRRSIWLKAAFAGVVLVSFDMLLDPISVVNQWWRWTSPGFYLRGVTFSNYIGWFFLLFFFGAVYERTVLQRRGFRWLSGLARGSAEPAKEPSGRLARGSNSAGLVSSPAMGKGPPPARRMNVPGQAPQAASRTPSLRPSISGVSRWSPRT